MIRVRKASDDIYHGVGSAACYGPQGRIFPTMSFGEIDIDGEPVATGFTLLQCVFQDKSGRTLLAPVEESLPLLSAHKITREEEWEMIVKFVDANGGEKCKMSIEQARRVLSNFDCGECPNRLPDCLGCPIKIAEQTVLEDACKYSAEHYKDRFVQVD